MNILHIWDSDYPWDVRVEKINNTLKKDGHLVHLLCRNLGMRRIKEFSKGIYIHRLPFLSKKLKRVNKALSFPFFFNPLWILFTLIVAIQNKIKIIIVRDLPLAPMGVWIGQLLKIPVVLDMAENYPYMLESIQLHEKGNYIYRIIRNPNVARRIEKYVFKRVKKIIVVIEESKERLLAKKIKKEKIIIVRNTPELVKYEVNQKKRKIKEYPFGDKNNIVLLYNGLTNPSRGVLDLIEKFDKIVRIFPNIKFVIIGKGKDDQMIHKKINNNGLKFNVFHKGWVSHEEKIYYLSMCDIGIIPYRITKHWNTTIPNKLFDYMYMKKPVLSTDIKPIARIINEANCGLIYNRENFTDFVYNLNILMNPNIRESFGQNGLKMVKMKYNWENDAKKLYKIFS